MKTHRCSATKCLKLASDTSALCPAHLAMLTDDTRALLGRVFKPGKRQSKRFLFSLGKINAEIDYFERVGHRVPRDGDLPLDHQREVTAHD